MKKSEEVKLTRLAKTNTLHGKPGKLNRAASQVSGQTKEITQRSTKDSLTKLSEPNDDEIFQKSRRMLEEKSKIYDKLRIGDDEDVSPLIKDNLLVDFDRKDWDEELKTFVNKDPVRPANIFNPPSEHVEFIDEFGRCRMVSIQEHEQLMSVKKKMADELIESLKPKIETVEETGPSHFDDTKEVRTLGVGFYRLSQNEEERKAQLEKLSALRQETVESRTKSMILKEQRKIMQEARLQKVQERRAKLQKK